jgi:hypothetical protein
VFAEETGNGRFAAGDATSQTNNVQSKLRLGLYVSNRQCIAHE